MILFMGLFFPYTFFAPGAFTSESPLNYGRRSKLSYTSEEEK